MADNGLPKVTGSIRCRYRPTLLPTSIPTDEKLEKLPFRDQGVAFRARFHSCSFHSGSGLRWAASQIDAGRVFPAEGVDGSQGTSPLARSGVNGSHGAQHVMYAKSHHREKCDQCQVCSTVVELGCGRNSVITRIGRVIRVVIPGQPELRKSQYRD